MAKCSAAVRTACRPAAVLAAVALACGVFAPAASASAGPASHAPAAEAPARPRAVLAPVMSAGERAFTGSRAGRALQAAEATARSTAMAARRPVTIASATTATSTLVAEPDGQFQETSSLQPARFRRNGSWVTINTSLRHGPGGTWVPAAVPSGVVLSGGGSGPAATLTSPAGRRASLRFPGPLGAPLISGSTATYRTADGQTLRLTVSPQGGVTEAVTAPGRAELPIRHLRPGLTISAALARPLAGTWSTAPARHPAFDVTTPVTVPAGGTRAAAAAGGTQVAVTVTPASLPACTSNGQGQACDNNASGHWTEIEEWAPSSGLYDVANANGYGEGIGDDVYSCAACIGRAYFAIPLNELNGNMIVSSATLYDTETYGSDFGCNDPWSARLFWTGTISGSTTWANPPNDIQTVGTDRTITPSYNPNGGGCPKDLSFSFNVTSEMQDATAGGWANWTVKIDGDEAAGGGYPTSCTGGDNGIMNGLSNAGYNCGWMQVSDNPEIITNYDLTPPEASNPEESPEPVDYPGHGDYGCASTTPYADGSSEQLSAQVYGNWSSEPVKGDFSMTDYLGSNVSLPDSGWAPSAETLDTTASDGDRVSIQATGLISGDEYRWKVYSETDGAAWGENGFTSEGPNASNNSPACNFIVDTAAPQIPAVTSDTVNANGSVTLTLLDSQNPNTACGITPTCFQSGIYDFEYSLNSNQFPAASTSTALASGFSSASPFPVNYTGPIVSSIQAAGAAMCLDDPGGSTTAGTPVDISGCNGSAQQDWTYDASTRELQVAGMFAGTAGNGTTAGTLVELEPCSTGTAGETWDQGTGGELVNVNSGDCLNDPSNATTPGTQQLIWTCAATGNEDYGNATATITISPAHWGTNTVYIQAQTTAGVPAATYYAYTFYVPSTATAVPGDVTGDGIPDLLATTTGGGLYVYPGMSGGDSLSAPQQASAAGGSPDSGSDWNDYLITHRGSLTGQSTDDLYAYNTKTGRMYEYTNADQTAGAFPGTLPYNDPGNTQPILKPTAAAFGSGYDGTSWSSADLTQMLAVGNPDTSTSSPTGLLTIENGNLWYYPGNGGGALNSPAELGTGWNSMTLIAPGYEGPQNQLVLWARDNTSGNLYSYQFSDDSGTWTLSTTGTAATITPEGSDATQITLPAGVPALTAAAYPAIASAGDATGPAALYLLDANGNIWALTGNPNPTSAADPLQGTLTQVATTPSGTTVQQLS